MIYGATPIDWIHFAEKLKLRGDLLPVVSNPDALIAPYSKMQDKGKTPSRYNSDKQVHGITQWTSVTADARDIRIWQKEPDYGICLQTRLVRALDVDVPHPALSARIERFIRDAVPGVYLPARRRPDTGKFLLAFVCDSPLFKRSFPVGPGAPGKPAPRIELLATGQQFVAIGRHPSGNRYVWDDGLPEAFPILTAAEVEELWDGLELCFSTGEGFRKVPREGGGASVSDMSGEDDVATYLAEHSLVLDEGPSCQLYIDCPWKGDHSSDNGVTQTAYFPAGTNGFECGHFKCLHDHCASRTDQEFTDAIGFTDDIEFRSRDFEFFPEITYLPAIPDLSGPADILEATRRMPTRLPVVDPSIAPIFKRDVPGRILVTADNITKGIECPPFITRKLRWDEFTSKVIWSWFDEADGAEAWNDWQDVDFNRLMRTLDKRGFKVTPGLDAVRRAVVDVAQANPIDTAMAWLNEQRWDGKSRCEEFLINYMGAPDVPYSRAVGLYIWSALAGRCLIPGMKADMAVIFQSEQGLAKTSTVEAIAPCDEWFGELDLDLSDADLSRTMSGKLVCELPELKGLANKQLEAIKAFVSRRVDEWVPKFMETTRRQHRRVLLMGTTNATDFLADPTGERRWLPVAVKQRADIERIRADRAQLWAEGRELFRIGGIAWEEAEKLAKFEHIKFKAHDPYEDRILSWLQTEGLGGRVPMEQPWLSVDEVIEHGLCKPLAQSTMQDQRRIGGILRALGYTSERRTEAGIQRRLWCKGE